MTSRKIKVAMGLGIVGIGIIGGYWFQTAQKNMAIHFQDAETREGFFAALKLTPWTTVEKPALGLAFQVPVEPFQFQNISEPVTLVPEEQTLSEDVRYAVRFAPLGIEVQILPKPADFDSYLRLEMEKQAPATGGLSYVLSWEPYAVGSLQGESLVYKKSANAEKPPFWRVLYVLGKNSLLTIKIPELAGGEPSLDSLMTHYLEQAILERITFS